MSEPVAWFEFMKLANEALKQGQIVDTYKPNIQIAIEPSFHNHVFLRLTWTNNMVNWYRTTWEKLTDAPKFNDPIEKLKYIGHSIKPTLTFEKGETDFDNIRQVVDFVKTISVKPQIEKGGIVIDGCYYTVIIGVDNRQAIYKWHYLPDDWKPLQLLANMLEELNIRL